MAKPADRRICDVPARQIATVVAGDRVLRQPELFVGTVVEKLMTYAFGRGVAADDMPPVQAIIRDSSGDYRFSSLVLGIVRSAPFTMRIKASPASAEATAGLHPEPQTRHGRGRALKR